MSQNNTSEESNQNHPNQNPKPLSYFDFINENQREFYGSMGF